MSEERDASSSLETVSRDSLVHAEPLDPKRAFSAVVYAVQGLKLVWRTSPSLFSMLVVSTLVAGIAPAGAAYVARIVVDQVVAAAADTPGARSAALVAIAIEAILVASVVAASRGAVYAQSLLKVRLAHSVTHLVLGKAITLRLGDFEDPTLNDRLEEARSEAAVRPLSLVIRTFTLVRYAISLAGYSVLLVQLSPWAVLALIAAGIPVFVVEARFSREAFRFFRRHSPENRVRHYLEMILTREDFGKEIGFFGLGKILLGRYDDLFHGLYEKDRRIAVKRHVWGLVLSILATGAFFGAYVWIVLETIEGRLTFGQMTMYLVVFRQGQSAVSSALTALGGVYDDALYLENLDELLRYPVPAEHGARTEGPSRGDGLRVEALSWTYEGTERPALVDVSFHIHPGETIAVVGHNGSGKSTLVKLLTRRYTPREGRIVLDGLDLREWSDDALRARISVLFQDFNRYKLTVGENIGAGDAERFTDRAAWKEAAERAMADALVKGLPQGYLTQLGKAFRGGHELSGGEWQRVAFARSLMRHDTDLLIFDEPTSAADPKQQSELDERLKEILNGRMGLIVSHRLATARIADRILVLEHGRIVEDGTHDELVRKGGTYAELFAAQAEGYR